MTTENIDTHIEPCPNCHSCDTFLIDNYEDETTECHNYVYECNDCSNEFMEVA